LDIVGTWGGGGGTKCIGNHLEKSPFLWEYPGTKLLLDLLAGEAAQLLPEHSCIFSVEHAVRYAGA
jgi:hypothetical protein